MGFFYVPQPLTIRGPKVVKQLHTTCMVVRVTVVIYF